jgi:hypothetical protein
LWRYKQRLCNDMRRCFGRQRREVLRRWHWLMSRLANIKWHVCELSACDYQRPLFLLERHDSLFKTNFVQWRKWRTVNRGPARYSTGFPDIRKYVMHNTYVNQDLPSVALPTDDRQRMAVYFCFLTRVGVCNVTPKVIRENEVRFWT